MPLSGKVTARSNVRKAGIKKGDKLHIIGTHPYAAPNGDTYYEVMVIRNGKTHPEPGAHSTVTHKELTGRIDQRPSK